jgi:hemerythrin
MKNALYIVWQATNNTGIPIIDEQHRGIVSTINSLYYFLQHGDAATAFEPTMDVLNHYTSLHFMTEEALMRAAGYPDTEEHVGLHNEFMNRSRAMARYRASEDQARELLGFLKDWWLGHINGKDRDYVAVMRKHLSL